jgi:hypothetical protein
MDTVREIYPAIAAFVLGCIVTEIRYIERIRKLRGLLGIYQDARLHGESAVPGAPGDAGEENLWSKGDAAQSLSSLQQHLSNEAQRSPVQQKPNVDAPTVQ